MLANALPPTLKESIYLSANGSGSTITNKIRLSIYLDILKMKFQLFLRFKLRQETRLLKVQWLKSTSKEILICNKENCKFLLFLTITQAYLQTIMLKLRQHVLQVPIAAKIQLLMEDKKAIHGMTKQCQDGNRNPTHLVQFGTFIKLGTVQVQELKP